MINNKLECSALRGIAIISICFHNYCHLLQNSAQENEFSYNITNYSMFCNKFINYDFLIQFFSYWGYLGVPIFVFLSGYGLSQKYNNKSNVNRSLFIANHFKKLATPLILGTIFYVFILYLIEGEVWCSPLRLFLQCTMLLNLAYGYEEHIAPGPYWYFGMTFQLYIIYALFVYKHNKKLSLLPLIISVVLLSLLQKHDNLLVWVRYNSLGWLLPFYMGIYAKHLRMVFSKIHYIGVFLASLFLIATFEANYYLWLWIPCITIFAAVSLIKLLNTRLLAFCSNVGKYSLFIFIIHPIVREVTLPMAETNGRLSGISLYLLGTLIFTTFTIFVKNRWFNLRNSLPR